MGTLLTGAAPGSDRGKQVAVDVASGLHWLHSHRIVHFDVKSQNILLARDGTAKISDVGLARILHRDYVTSLDSSGTFAWAAPELLLGRRCTEKVRHYPAVWWGAERRPTSFTSSASRTDTAKKLHVEYKCRRM